MDFRSGRSGERNKPPYAARVRKLSCGERVRKSGDLRFPQVRVAELNRVNRWLRPRKIKAEDVENRQPRL